MKSNDPFSTVLVIGFFVFFVVALVYALIYNAKRSKKWMATAQQVGLNPAVRPDEELTGRLRKLYEPAPKVSISNLTQKAFEGGMIYLYDISTSSPNDSRRGGSTGNVEYRNIAVVGPRLNLPSFLMLYRLPSIGPLGNVLNDLMATGAAWAGFTEWDQVTPDFSLHYVLFTKNEAEVARIFDADTLSRIAQTPHMLARGQGDILVYNTYDGRRGVEMDANGLAEHIRQAVDLYNILSR